MEQGFSYNQVEAMQNSNTMHITKVFNRRAVYSDGTRYYRFPQEPLPQSLQRIRLRTARSNVNLAIIASGEERYPMKVVERDDLFDFFEGQLPLGDTKKEYYFIIWCSSEYYFYNQIGVQKDLNQDYNFAVRPGFSTPAWAKGAVFYQIFVDRFKNGTTSNDPMNREYRYINDFITRVTDWNKPPAAVGMREFYGGDLQGLWEKLDYLQELGIEALYLNPIFVSPSNHKYDIQDYDYVDPHFAVILRDEGRCLDENAVSNEGASKYMCRVTNKENLEESNRFFASLVEEIHRRGMRVIIDGVFNHCGSFNKWLDREKLYKKEEGYENGAFTDINSPYRTFFDFKQEPENIFEYDGWWGHDTLPKLNFENSPLLEEEILRIARKWVSPPYNVDGWRLDVAADLGHSPEYNHKFWKKFRDVVKEANPNALILAEHYGDPSSWLQGDEWDSIMNYDAFMEPLTWFLTGMEKHSDQYRGDMFSNSDAFIGAMNHCMSKFLNPSLEVAMNEISNHDHSRFMTRTGRKVGRTEYVGSQEANTGTNQAIMREAVLIQMTWPGAPTLYYGDEAGLCGWTDPDNRRAYPWGREDLELIRFHRELIAIHKAYDALRYGSLKFLTAQPGVICYGRFDTIDRFIITVNNNSREVTVDIPVWETGIRDSQAIVRMAYTTKEGFGFASSIYRAEHGVLHLRLMPNSGLLLKNMPDFMM